MFTEGRPLVLGGVEIPAARGLGGHSDADVVVHALMDALLGACGAGDIGTLFPDTDPAFAGISSLVLLRRVVDMVSGMGYRIANADISVVCEEPRVAPHRSEMRLKISTALGVNLEAVSVKGTTTEGMGFTGRGEGIAAIATVLLE